VLRPHFPDVRALDVKLVHDLPDTRIGAEYAVGEAEP
jgi:hypothetical protein